MSEQNAPRHSGTGATSRAGDQTQTAEELQLEWSADPRWDGIRRDYTAADVIALRGSVAEEHTLARRGAERLWEQLQRTVVPGSEVPGSEAPDSHVAEADGATSDGPHWIAALGALTGNQAVQQVRAGLEAIYLSGWQVAADANLAGQTYPDQSLYPANSVPAVVRRINNALLRADQIDASGGAPSGIDWLVPIVADAEAGFGGPLNAYELMRSMIEAGAAGVHYEDQLASEKKCGHLGGKVLVPTSQFVRTLNAARLAADVLEVPTIL
ncbi:MAG: isocitrate lyase/phosphoenolpyruvate mutase family protein, partial [Humibacter sp.]